ncbi:MAG: hypothetical protein ABSH00_19880 [Bryobacteraceae bacterium]|jgi:hypothetical protein
MPRLRLHTKRAFTLCLLAAGAPLGAQNSHPPLDSHFENDQVILNAPHPGINIPGAAAGKNWHKHPLNRVMVYLHTGGEKLTYLDGRVEDLKWQAGTVRWSPATGYHYSEPPAWKIPPYTGPMIVDIGIKKAGNPGKVMGTALDPLRADPQDFTLVFENNQVRVLRLKVGPRQSVPMHEYVLNHLVVYITDQNVRETSPEGKVEVTQYKAGDTSWGGPSRQKVDNLNDKPFEAVVVELKS